MTDEPITVGAANPYALAEAALGRRVDWRREPNRRAIVETALGRRWSELIDPESESILFTGSPSTATACSA